jgi:hypothetical protein
VVTAHCEVIEQAPQTAVMTSAIPVNSMRSIRRAKSEQRRHTPEVAVYIPRRSCIPPSVGDCHHPPSSSPHRHLFPEPTQSKATLTFNFTLFLSFASAPVCTSSRSEGRFRLLTRGSRGREESAGVLERYYDTALACVCLVRGAYWRIRGCRVSYDLRVSVRLIRPHKRYVYVQGEY